MRSRKPPLSKRAQQVMDVLYRLGEASAREIWEQVPSIPSYSAVRSILRSLRERRLVRSREKGLRYVYVPAIPKAKARQSMLQHLLDNYFDGSPEKTMKALLDLADTEIYDLDLEEMERMIGEARKRGR